MRNLIVEELNLMYSQEDGFSRRLSRWSPTFYGDYLDEVLYPTLSDVKLLEFYRLIIKQLYRQM